MRSSNFVNVRKITEDSADAFRNLFLQILKENPSRFHPKYEKECLKPLSSFRTIIQECDSCGGGVFVAECEGEPCGLLKLCLEDAEKPHIGYLGSMGVLDAYKRRGIGKELQSYVIDWARRNANFKKLKIITYQSNRPAIDFAKAFGFEETDAFDYHGVPAYALELKLQSR